MRFAPTCVLAFFLAAPVQAQLAPPNADGITFAHVHLNVADVDAHERLWVEQFDGVAVQKGSLRTVKLPGMLVVFTERAPTGGSQGTVMDHVGLAVPDLAAALVSWRAAGYEVQAEFTGLEGTPNAYLMAPEGVRVELQEDPTLTVKAKAYHLHFFTPEFTELLGWYAETFSASPRARGTIETTADVPGMNLSFTTSRADRPGTRGRAIDHIGFEVDNLEAFCAMLAEKGIEFDLEYRQIGSIELAIAFFTDPSGVYIELTEGFDKY
jgi:catechol 2,3-dioxygenase-like lactoylglutathione lyase family enzyme